MTIGSPEAAIIVFQDRYWFGDPRLAAFTVSVDGKKVGRAALNSSLRVPVSPGRHTVRIRQWWFRSSRITVEVSSGSNVKLKADAPTGFAGMVKLMFRPSTALMLESSDIQPNRADANTRLRASQRARKSLLLEATLGLIGCVLILSGLKTGPALIVVGLVVLIGGTALGVRGVLSAKRESSARNPS
jgi:hypothetical protein